MAAAICRTTLAAWITRTRCGPSVNVRFHDHQVRICQLYYDSVIYTGTTLAALIATVGSDRVMLGTDYPFDMGESDPVSLIAQTRGLTRADKERVWGGNAAQLLGLQ
ncbi:MAG: hypothetical protein FJ147_24325 [Deltaproteobacteria bacterium]|nr:hypothetical protein [Deltaproteobacteria bacterium]